MTAWKLILQLHQSMVKTDRCILNSVIVWIRVDQGRRCRHSANGCCRLLGRITIGKLQPFSDSGILAMAASEPWNCLPSILVTLCQGERT
jgi:hypothetical protein